MSKHSGDGGGDRIDKKKKGVRFDRNPLLLAGGDDGVRTRDLRRDRPAF